MPTRPTGEQFVLAHPGAEVTMVEVGGGLRRRPGRPADEVATAAAFLLGPDAGFITGTDLLSTAA